MRSITEMAPGDLVKVGPDRYEEIAEVSPGIVHGQPIPKRFWVVTRDGRRVDMFEALAYFKKEDPRP